MSDPVRDYQRAAQVRPLEGEIPANDDRLAQASAEAERQCGRIGGIPQDALFMSKMGAFVDGVEWADAHPYSTPEALVAAYEEGQRDAVSKGLANPQPRTITRAALRDTAMMLEHTRQDEIEAMLPGLLGIEVRDE